VPCTAIAITTLFERRVARALADPVHRELDLTRARADRSQRVGRGEAEIVLAVERYDRLRELRNAREELRDQYRDLIGKRATHRVGDVDRARPRGEGGAHDVHEELRIGARGVHRAELHVVRRVARAGDGVLHHAQHLLPALAELVREVDVARIDERVDAGRLGAPQRLGRGVDVERHRARERADRRATHLARHGVHCAALGRRSRGEAGLDHVDAHGRRAPARSRPSAPR
jgi:hypothetical protein